MKAADIGQDKGGEQDFLRRNLVPTKKLYSSFL